MERRALHFVFKVGNRSLTTRFYRDVLGMKILRHEEFDEGCKASCNGPYDGKWSKTMVGYGPEDNHFVVELTYNYGISGYKLGNDFLGLTLQSSQVLENAKNYNWPVAEENGISILEAPGGYKFFVVNQPQPLDKDPVQKITLACSNMDRSLGYWNKLCLMKIYSQNESSSVLGYADDQCKLELKCINQNVDHAKAFGRIAFSCPSSELKVIEETMKKNSEKILTPLISLDTPGKATVEVIILADPDGHEICFVGDEAFRQLSQFDPNGDALLNKAMEEDKSNEWFARKGIEKSEDK